MQVHVSEYGVHWNFFYTLMATSLVLALLPLRGIAAAAAAVGIACCHQAWLSQQHIRAWLESDTRDVDSVFDANREGICSLPGYVALCYAGCAVAALMQPPRATRRNLAADSDLDGKQATEQALTDLVATNGIRAARRHCTWWLRLSSAAAVCTVTMHAAQWQLQPVSRRFCNLAYVLWIAREGMVLLLSCWAVECCVVVMHGRPANSAVHQGISRHQLAVFLAANVLTGVVNMSMDTLYASDADSTGVLLMYCMLWASVPAGVERISALFKRATNVARRCR